MAKPKPHIRKDDTVKIITGNYKGQTGKVLRVYPAKCKAAVLGMNIVTRHVKPSQKQPKGSIQKREAPIHLSNLMLVDPSTNMPTRIGRKLNSQGQLQRYAKKTDNLL